MNDTNWKHYSNRSAAYLAKGVPKRALRDAEKCLELDKSQPVGYLRQGSAFVAMGKYGQAVAAYMTGLGLDATNKIMKDALEEARSRHSKSRLSDFSALEAAEAEGDEDEDEQDKEEARMKAEMLAFLR